MTHAPFFLSLFALVVVVSVAQEAHTPTTAPAASQDSLREERTELAEIRLLLGVQRDYARARPRLAALATRLAASTAPGAAALLAEVEGLALEVRRALGEAIPAGVAGEDKVDQAIQNALLIGDFAFVTSMGKRAVPTLQDAIRRQPDLYPSDPGQDPLALLVEIDPLAASEVMGEFVERDSFLWRKRALRLLGPELAGKGGLWLAGPERQRWLGIGLTKTAERHVDDAEVGLDALEFLCALTTRGERSSVLEAALGRALRSTDTERRKRAKVLGRRARFEAGFFESLLEEQAEDLRSYAAEMLRQGFPASRALLAHGEDSSVDVRNEVARWLADRDPGTWSEEERRTLGSLLQDSVDSVRRQAFSVLDARPKEREAFEARSRFTREFYAQPWPDAFYRALVGRGFDSEAVPIVIRLQDPLCFELAEALARGPEAAARNALASVLFELPFWRDPVSVLRIVGVLLDSSPLEDRARNRLEGLLANLGQVPGGEDLLLDWLLAHPDAERLARMNDMTPFQARHLAEADPDLALPFLARLFPLERDEVLAFFVGKTIVRDWTPEQSRATRALVQDAAQPVGLRLAALNGLLNDGEQDADFGDLARGVLEDPAWRTEPEWERKVLVNLLRRDLGATANALILFALRNPSLPESLALLTVECIEPTCEGAAEIVQEVVQRGFGKESWEDAVQTVLWAMKDSPPLADRALLARAVHHPRLRRTALGVIGALRDPSTLPLVSEVLAEPVPAYEIRWAAEALFGFLDAEAFEPLLLAAAKVQDAEVRDQCLAHLEKIREYQAARDLWAAREASGQTRERVIGELLDQLDAKSEEVRVQAIRALATWKALEAMPRLIQLTASGSKAVAASAREALARLNTPPKD